MNNKKLRFTKKKSIVILSIISVLLILAIVFAFVPVKIGTTDYVGYINAIKKGLDLEGGVYAVYEAVRPNDNKGAPVSDEEFLASVNGTAVRLQELLFSKGYPEAQVSVSEGDYQIRVEVPDVDDPERIFSLIGRPASLEFYETDAQGNKADANAKPYLTGKDVKSASVGMQENKYVIQLEFTTQGTKKFAEATSALQGKNMGIFINGELLMAPTVNTPITDGKAVIEGNYTYEQAYEHAVSIQSGALAVELKLLESDTISATLGVNATTHGLIAGAAGLLLIMLFMIWRYKLLGVAASISLCFFTVTYLFFLSIFPWVQLTLPGIAGILLSIGMAVDANVIIFERVKEERKNYAISTSVDIGFKKSLSAILDGNITTIIGAAVLMFLAASAIKGFAITLLIGIIISLLSSLLFTRLIIKIFLSFNDSSDKLYGTSPDGTDYEIYDDEDSEDVSKEVKA